MINELSCKLIYNDFVEKMFLTEDEAKVLNMMIAKYSLVKMGDNLNMSERNAGRIVKEVKEKYRNYKKLELAKLEIFKT